MSELGRQVKRRPAPFHIARLARLLEARTGRLFADILPEWSLANIMDDHPLGTPTLPRLRQPSWNFRDVFSGLHTDFATTYPNTWPLVPFTRSFGGAPRAVGPVIVRRPRGLPGPMGAPSVQRDA